MSVPVALLLDQTFREPPLRWHPTRLIGRALERSEPLVPATPPATARRRGAAVWVVGAAAATAAGVVAERAARRSPAPWLVRGVLLWPLLSRRLLLDEVAAVAPALHRGLPAGRAQAGRLVSRDLTAADAGAVASAAIGSLAENASDAIIAPLWWFALAGLPGAAVYRFANTADACWGYRDPRWEHAGWAAARADDLLNLVPARLTGWALLGGRAPWRRLRTEAARTPSPNGGWPMAAVALARDVRIDKPGTYVLHAEGRTPAPGDITWAVRWVARRTTPVVAVAVVLAAVRGRVAAGVLAAARDRIAGRAAARDRVAGRAAARDRVAGRARPGRPGHVPHRSEVACGR